MCECDFDLPEVQATAVRKAAKDHQCYECCEPIRKGDLYQVESGVSDGAGYSFKWCGTCATIANLASGIHPGFCYAFGSMLEAVEECILAYEPGGRWYSPPKPPRVFSYDDAIRSSPSEGDPHG